ncbi:hypothetical protein BH09MYX1_BH09MYX1_06020 [soil metagenome]
MMKELLSKWTRRTRRGAVMVEYAFLLTFVMVPVAGVLVKGGQIQYTQYVKIRSEMLSPFP